MYILLKVYTLGCFLYFLYLKNDKESKEFMEEYTSIFNINFIMLWCSLLSWYGLLYQMHRRIEDWYEEKFDRCRRKIIVLNHKKNKNKHAK